MRLHVRATDTGEVAVFDGDDTEAFRRFVGNCLATLEVSAPDGDGFTGPVVEIRWVPDA